ncbi:hypothetical protein C2W64_02763 [Brevibacillus laterosporus]|nr:hypothetical protein C2W64_02763 [Brevibacillus laterosporus]
MLIQSSFSRINNRKTHQNKLRNLLGSHQVKGGEVDWRLLE